MARIVGIVLMLLGIWYGLSVYQGEAAGDATAAASAEEAASAAEPTSASGQATPSAVTSRVRERVNAAIAEGYERHTSE
jgi:hypothetical protein